MVYSVKRKELYVYICREYPWTCPSTMTKSTKFFLLLLYFFNLFAIFPSFSFLQSFFLFFFFSLPFFFSFFVLYTMIFFYHFLHPRVGQVLGVLFLYFPCLFLNLLFLAVRLHVHCSGITSTLMRLES